ncbi:MAG: histone deacetylase [Bryobacteraceae bacterium]|nr:histone deacetylase [Bryobacteraceae bacterium]
MSKAGLVFDERVILHDPGDGHPESPERVRVLRRVFQDASIKDRLPRIHSRMATGDDLRQVHTKHYMDVVRHDLHRKSRTLSTGDTGLNEHSETSALAAAGATLAAVDAVFQTPLKRAFAAVRPPGHHATASRGMGFCIFNNAALAARYARKAHGVDRVLIADWDVHHGNGTQDIFYADPAVFFFSTHQWPWYPGTGAPDETGEGAGKGLTMNCPFPAGSGRAEILGAFRKKLMPAMDDFKPGLVIVSAGFDSRRGDPLGKFTLTDGDFRELTELMLEIAGKHAGGRLVSVLEGGYSMEGLARAVKAHVQTLMEA